MLEGWEFTPGKITARWIKGRDGLPKVQLRLDLGVLQMELEGRPDGATPHGYPSLLEHYLALEENATPEASFGINEESCNALQQEAVQYYNRYLAFLALGYLDGVIRDTEHTIEIFSFVARHATNEDNAWQFLQFYPYVRMMNARAIAEKSVKQHNSSMAIRAVKDALDDIKEFQEEYFDYDEKEQHEELDVLNGILNNLLKVQPKSQLEQLREDLDRAISAENYEKAAEIRDALSRMERNKSSTSTK